MGRGWRQLPHRIEALETRRFYGRMLLDRDQPGDRAEAEQLLTDAIAGYLRLGMPKHADLAAATLAGEPR